MIVRDLDLELFTIRRGKVLQVLKLDKYFGFSTDGLLHIAHSYRTIDRDELNKCVKKLEFYVQEEEIDNLFDSCDVDEKEGIQFNKFIVLSMSYLSRGGFILLL
ncbi:hypothetical protein FXO37_00764 [Capsicum annuum]|nr:hypothetical protein FXO37_00764 [Capsicum annuum]